MISNNNQAEWDSVNATEAQIENVLKTYRHKLKISTNIWKMKSIENKKIYITLNLFFNKSSYCILYCDFKCSMFIIFVNCFGNLLVLKLILSNQRFSTPVDISKKLVSIFQQIQLYYTI